MIAANLPDIDVLAFATATPAVALRRGWTHGVAAQLVLPVALAGLVWAVGRRASPQSDARRAAHDAHTRTSFLWLLALSYIGVYSHVAMDWLNNYGVRLLTPFDWRWFYGDAVFILDPWLWLSLGVGVWLARRWHAVTPARAALLVAACYIAAMLVSARAARAEVIAAWRDARGSEPRAVMVGPRPVTPFSRDVIIDAGEHYETGLFTW